MSTTYQSILFQQRAWADKQGIRLDKNGYTFSLNHNLYLPLSPQTIEEYSGGRGNELGNAAKRGKMQAVHSSSALVVNVFEYWRQAGKSSDIALLCGGSPNINSMGFERKFPTPAGRIPPHLDVELEGGRARPMAVESKFNECYLRKTKRKIKDKYIYNEKLWKGLSGCEELAQMIRLEEQGKTSFAYLDVPQLIKHILGLYTKYGDKGFEIVYLWYYVPSVEASKHRAEIERFKRYIKDEASFRDMTYQELFEKIKRCNGIDGRYVAYLAERYFPLP